MKIVNAGFEVFDPIDGSNTLKKIERVRLKSLIHWITFIPLAVLIQVIR